MRQCIQCQRSAQLPPTNPMFCSLDCGFDYAYNIVSDKKDGLTWDSHCEKWHPVDEPCVDCDIRLAREQRSIDDESRQERIDSVTREESKRGSFSTFKL